MCKTLEIEQKGVKLVDASGMAVRVHAEKAVSAEEEQEWEVLTESVGRKSGRLETWKNAASQLRDRAVKQWRNRGKM